MTDRHRPVAADVLADDWGTLTRYTFDYRRADGRWDRQRREVYDRGHAAACLLHDPAADTLLLVRQFRLPMLVSGQEPFLVEVPAGLLDGAEPAERMRAELREETGFEPRSLRHVADLVMSPGSVTERIACYLGTYDRDAPVGAGGGEAGEGEDIEVLHLPADEAAEMLRTGAIVDAKTAFLLQRFELDRLGGG